MGFQGGTMLKNPPTNAGNARNQGSIPGPEEPLKEEVASHSSVLAWKIRLT